MVHKLTNWILLRDLMCANKETAKYIFESAYKEMTKNMHINRPPSLSDDRLKNMISGCGCTTISQEGFIACLITWKDDLSPLFKCPEECPEFEQFLLEIDTILFNVKETIVEKHQL